MPVIRFNTVIAAPIQRCFDAARDIDLHIRSMRAKGERAVAGTTTGRLGLGDEVTWEATHFLVKQRLTSRITLFNPPVHFRDSQMSGAFARFDHDHYFASESNGRTVMTDLFDYTSPMGLLGKVADYLFLTRYMAKLLSGRAITLKSELEGRAA